MAVEFSAVKEQLLRHDGIARFASLADSMTPALRLQGVWGLSSVAYMSSQEVGAGGVRWSACATVGRMLMPQPMSPCPLWGMTSRGSRM